MTDKIPIVIVEPVPLAKDLLAVRDELARLEAEIERLEVVLLDNPDFVSLLAAKALRAERVTQGEQAKSLLAAELVKAYNVTGEKKFEGIGQVKIRKAVAWDATEAVKWCISSGMHGLLTVKSEFKPVAEGIAGSVDWVDVKDDPYAAINSKLEL